VARRRRKTRRRSLGSGRALARRLLLAAAALPALYLLAALIGSLVPVNRGWTEPGEGVTIYLADNGIHADIIMPVVAQGLDWRPLLPERDYGPSQLGAQWVAFGSGEERVYLETPRWRDIEAKTIWSALTGGKRVMHVEWVRDTGYAAREIRLRPEEYRRLWAAVRGDFERDAQGRAEHIDAPGYGCCDGFYRATGKASALRTCNSWAAHRLRLAGVKTSAWPPFVQGLTWRYRRPTVMPAKAGTSGRKIS
jgi:uncharacterized protein (TIGR02117 family)